MQPFDKTSPAYAEAVKCNKCGFCQELCPIFHVTGSEQSVARGRNIVARALMEGTLDLTPEVKSYLFECLMCRGCTSSCFPAIHTDEIMAAARAAYVEKFGQPLIMSFLFRKLLPDRPRLKKYARLLSLGKRTGLSGVARLMRIFGLYGKTLATAEELMERVPKRFLEDRLPEIALEPREPKHRVNFFLGCGMNFALPDASEAAIRLLVTNGCSVRVLENHCCGLPAYAYGDLEAARTMARANLERMAESEADFIVTECASCSAFLREYPVILRGDAQGIALTERILPKLRDFSEMMLSLAPLNGLEKLPLRVTYHDPCHQNRYQGLRCVPRKLIRMIPGVDFVDLPESDWCCGGAGSYNIAHYALSMKVLERKMENIKKTDAQAVVTSCPSCMIQLAYGIRKQGLGMEVLHLSELLARSAKILLPSQNAEFSNVSRLR